jgi:hypothetical protein
MGPGFKSQPDHETQRQIEVKFCLAFVFQGVMNVETTNFKYFILKFMRHYDDKL